MKIILTITDKITTNSKIMTMRGRMTIIKDHNACKGVITLVQTNKKTIPIKQ